MSNDERLRAERDADTREARLERRIADLYSDDAQFAAAKPDEAVSAAANHPGLRLPDVVRTVLEGYADRPAVGQRAVEYVADASGRTVAKLQPRFATVTYGELWDRVQAFSAAVARPTGAAWRSGRHPRLHQRRLHRRRHRADATRRRSVPLQTSAPLTQLQPIIAETEPVLIASSIDYLDDAVELIRTGPRPRDWSCSTTSPRSTTSATPSRRPGHASMARSPSRRLARCSTAAAHVPRPRSVVAEGDDPLALLVYTSGSTGAPKGAIYPEGKVANMWRAAANAHWDENQGVLPAISLAFLPMSHVMGRGVLYSTLASGGTVYFAARSDLSTFLEDLALARPTQMNFVPRIWDMLYQEYVSEVDRRGVTDRAGEKQVMVDLRQSLLGGRFVTAITGSAPISPELKSWVESFLDMHLVEGYGSTEAGSVFVDGQIRRPPVLDYKLVDVPDLGYFGTDVPHPRGELLVKSDQLFPGYYKRPEVTAEVFDEDGYYRTGDVVAELGPDEVKYLDRRNNVLKLSQGEFVTVSKLEAVFGNSPLVRQIYIYGNSARPYLLAVVVPTADTSSRYGADELKSAISASLKDAARSANLQSYEIPRDFLVETTPFTMENGLLTGIRKLAWPRLKERYGAELEQLYVDLSDSQAGELRALRQSGVDRPVLETVSRAASALLGAAASDVPGRCPLHRSGRRLVVGVDVRQPAPRDLRRRRARRRHRQPGQRRGRHRRICRGATGRRQPRGRRTHPFMGSAAPPTRPRCTPAI